MRPIILKYPIRTLDGKLLMDKEEEITPDRMERVMAQRDWDQLPYELFLGHGSVREDMRTLLSKLPNPCILPDAESIEGLLLTMHAIVLPTPVLLSLDYFRDNDFYTYRHTLVVFALTTLLARDLLADYPERIAGSAAGPIHDIGKTCVPLEILCKSTPLTHEERAILEHHTAAGYVLLSYYSGDPEDTAARVARDHHERCNGSGYPRGILLSDPVVDIITVCDVYDALVSDRPYRAAAYDNRTALEEITGMATRGELNINAVKALIAHNRGRKPDYNDVIISSERRGRPPSGNVYGTFAK